MYFFYPIILSVSKCQLEPFSAEVANFYFCIFPQVIERHPGYRKQLLQQTVTDALHHAYTHPENTQTLRIVLGRMTQIARKRFGHVVTVKGTRENIILHGKS